MIIISGGAFPIVLDFKKIMTTVGVSLATVISLSSCVGTQSLFVDPSDNGYPYMVTYDALGGTINTIEKRTVYYADNSLIFEPQGSSGMLVEPKNGSKILVGWYTSVSETETEDGSYGYVFNEDDLWNFDTDRVTSDNTVKVTEENGKEYYELTLYANWIDAPTLEFVDAEDTSKVYLKWNPTIGSEIVRPTTSEPKKDGYTLVDYYMDPECTVKAVWGGENGVSIQDIVDGLTDSSVKTIYCKFIEGEYSRVRSVTEFKTAVADGNAKILLANDIDFNGEDWNASSSTFTGEIFGNGYSICNMNIVAKNKVSGIGAKSNTEKCFGIFAQTENAKFTDILFKDITFTVDASSNCKIAIGVISGRASGTVLNSCKFDNIKFTATSDCNIEIAGATTFIDDGTCSKNGVEISNVTVEIQTDKTLDFNSEN